MRFSYWRLYVYSSNLPGRLGALYLEVAEVDRPVRRNDQVVDRNAGRCRAVGQRLLLGCDQAVIGDVERPEGDVLGLGDGEALDILLEQRQPDIADAAGVDFAAQIVIVGSIGLQRRIAGGRPQSRRLEARRVGKGWVSTGRLRWGR